MSTPSVQEHYNLVHQNTMGVEANARYFVSVKSVEDLKKTLSDSRFENLPLLVLGGGSNLLFLHDFDGFVIHNQIPGKELIEQTENEVLLKAGAGENWHQLVQYCVDKGFGGIENLSLIPGLTGAAPIQNIGAYGVELVDVFEYLEAVEISTGEVHAFKKNECKFGYRDSIFKNELKGKFIITSVTLRLQKEPEINISYRALSEKLDEKRIQNPTIKDVSEAVIEIRQSKLPDPSQIGNTGSFFKNPVVSKKQFNKLQKQYPEIPHYPAGEEVKIPAAWLIEKSGWKGKRVGDAGVHKMQALVIVNYGGATGEEIWNLALKIQESVQQSFGIKLVPEVNVVG